MQKENINLLREIVLVEKNILKNEKINEYVNYYNFVEKNKNLFLNTYKILNETNIKKITKFRIIIEDKLPNDINFTEFDIIKSKKNLINFLLTIVILKTFSKQSIYDIKKENNIQHIYTINNVISNKIENILIFLEIVFKFSNEIDLVKIYDFTMEIIYLLINKDIIKKEIYVSNKKKRTFIYIENINYDDTVILCFERYKIYEKKEIKYLYSSHFSFTNKIFKKNMKSNYFFQTNIKSKLFENIVDNFFYIDKNQLSNLYNELLKDSEYEFLDLENYHKILKEKFISSIKLKDVSSISFLAKKISKIQNLLKLKYILNMNLNNKKIYIPFSFDFRGRLYYDSEISISYYKEFRYCINLGKYEEIQPNDHLFNSIIDIEIKKHFIKLENLNKYKFNEKKEVIKIAIIWLLVSLGEINKVKLGKKVHISKFIDEGIKIINKELKIEDFDVYERIKINYIENIFEEIDKDVFTKWLISKDATASVYQHLVKTCGHKNNNVLKWCNLKSKENWYDTYEFIIEEFKKSNEIDDDIDKLFNRKNLKKIMMTENYSASYNTCKEYFLEKIDITQYSDKQNEKIFRNFKNFYTYISNNKFMFELDLKEILEYFKKNDYVVYLNNESEDVVILKYYKGSAKQKEITIGNTRYTYQKWNLDKRKLDSKKIRSSIKANYIHTIDAALLRWVLSQAKIYAVHDCFFIDYINLSFLVSILNDGMRINFHTIEEAKEIDIFSLFIVL